MITERQLQEIVGVSAVSEEPGLVEAYAKDLSFVARTPPRFVVKVKTPEAIQELVKLAADTGTPLVPVSSGAPHFNGDTVPAIGGAVVVDLSDMRQITWINGPERVAVLEPGVTFGELIPAIAEEGLRLNMPLRPRKTKSVIGSLLSREPVLMPHYHWDISDPLGSTEVIFGTGDLFRTGAAATPGTIEEQRKAGGAQKESAGPSANSWHRVIQGAQGTMAIVTWASTRCELLPKMERPFFVASVDLGKLVEAARWLIRLRLGNECLILDRVDALALMLDAGLVDPACPPRLPAWLLFFNLAAYDYLPELRMDGQIADSRDVLQRIGVEARDSLSGVAAGRFLESIRQPSSERYWKLRRTGACQDIFFLTNQRNLPRLVTAMAGMAEVAGFSAGNIGTYIQPIVQGTSWHCEFSLFFDAGDEAERGRVRALARQSIPALMAHGAFFSRPFGDTARDVMNRDAATVATLKKVKQIVDPAGILNPGKLCF
jgi:FAD/FMN-containing dehydrogenase